MRGETLIEPAQTRANPSAAQKRRVRHWSKAAAGAALALGAASAHAYDFTNSPYLLGDWNGMRTRLADKGINFSASYTGELAHNFSGGTDHLTRYTDQWAIGTNLDLNKLIGWKGAQFQFTMTDRNGRDLGADAHIGNNMLIQEVYGRGQTWHLTQFWINQKLFDDRLQIKLGRLTLGEDFASFSCDFENLTFCGSQPGNLVGGYWLNWPTSVWAARVKFQPVQQFYGQIGIYQVNPNYVSDSYARHNGWKPGFPDGTTGALIPVEFGWLPSLGGMPGSYKLGFWYNTSSGDDLFDDINHDPRGLTGLPALKRSGQYGVYVNIQQQITGSPGGQGATVFLNITQADRNTAAVDGQIAAGVQYKGPFNRLRDSVGFAIGATHNNGRYADYVRQNNLRTGGTTIAGSGYEYVSELYYTWSPAASMYFRPNLQYILHPGGTSKNKNAFVIGLKTGLTF
ncbi:carbohydrate porin [Burkholderia singularis]|uniref:PUTATIVE PORIN B OUTER (GLUCOSE PORIN) TRANSMEMBRANE PROTEIN n=1 Tax=Burkholderia singularis TaxID=1503053 RepID=A0A238H297_9BURK|nr:carbohydrate porin [Burkholderia singularis]SMF99389.1 PUTATIVE PORIN B PRECURSOR OUTER (GLUCOSE PORIN) TRANSMEMBRANE PROTEIN [Burkholderia singularis]